MIRIALISDTHGFLDPKVFSHVESCDEIWHAGDFGTIEVFNALNAFKPLRAVYGNIDGQEIRAECPETAIFNCAGLQVYMRHIGGYPGRYAPGVEAGIRKARAGLFISGHSHILKVMYDAKNAVLHMNPGAAGKQGWHKARTILRFSIKEGKPRDLEVIELGSR